MSSIASPPEPLQSIIPSYAYQQYADDENIVAFVEAFNGLAQGYLGWFNSTPIALYTSPQVVGPLLDWVGQGLYGVARPVFSSGSTAYIAGLNSLPLNTIAVNGHRYLQIGTATLATDDYYKRVLTWATYVGDGRFFNCTMLRERIARFLFGVNGTDISLDQAQQVSINAGLLNAPPQPSLSQSPGGSFGARTYDVQTTYVTALGETNGSYPGTLIVNAGELLNVASPSSQSGSSGYNVYVGILSVNPTKFLAGLNSRSLNFDSLNGSNKRAPTPPTKQNTTPIAFGIPWGEPSTGLVAGGQVPVVNTSNTPINLFVSVPASQEATIFTQAIQEGILAFPFELTINAVGAGGGVFGWGISRWGLSGWGE